MFYSVTCKNPDCGKRFKIRGPLKAGVHKVGCPFCSKKMSVRIKGDAPAAPAEQSKRAAVSLSPALHDTTEQVREKYERALASLQASHTKKQAALKETYEKKRAALKAAFDSQRSANEAEYVKAKGAVEAEMQAALNAARRSQSDRQAKTQDRTTEGGKVEAGSAHQETIDWAKMSLGLQGGMMQPAAASQHTAPKPMSRTERPYLIANHRDTGRQLRFVSDECGRPFGSPMHRGSDQSTEKAYLKAGSNTIGRYDPMTPSDIGIDGLYDSRMSRCSTCIEVTKTPQGYKFAFILRNSKNPVLCNGLMMVANTPYPINYGADIIMGETRFTLMCEM